MLTFHFAGPLTARHPIDIKAFYSEKFLAVVRVMKCREDACLGNMTVNDKSAPSFMWAMIHGAESLSMAAIK